MANQLTIVFVTNNYTPYSGGVVSSIQAFTHELRALGHRVYIVTLDFARAPEEEWVIRVPCPIKFVYKNNQMAVPWRMRRALKDIFLRLHPDIVHSHHPFLLGPAAYDVCKEFKIPIIFTFHSHYEKFAHYIPLPAPLVRAVTNRLVAHYCARVGTVIAPSLSVKRWLIKWAVSCRMVSLSSPLLPLFAQQLEQFNLKKRAGTFKLLFVGRFAHEKNIKVLLDCVKELAESDIELTLAGFGYQEQELKNYAYNVLLLSAQQVHFVVRPTKQDLCTLYAQADLFVFCSQTETQGLVLVEAMAAGTPVICLHGPGQEDVIQNGINGFIVRTPQEFVAKISAIMADQMLFEKLQKGARCTACTYTVQLLTEQLLRAYEQLL